MKNIKDNVYIGDKQDAEDSEMLSDNDIRTVVSLIEDNVADRNHMNRRCYRSFALLDNDANPQEQVDAAIYNVAGEIEAQQNFLVHCHAGMSRSPAILTAALALVEDKTFDEALEYMRNEYHATSIQPELEKQVRQSVDRFKEGVVE